MKKQNANQATINQNENIKISHYSDGSELVPSEIISDIQSNKNLVIGYNQDDGGIISNHALEPAIFAATYPTSKQKFRYVFLGVGALVFIGILFVISFSIS